MWTVRRFPAATNCNFADVLLTAVAAHKPSFFMGGRCNFVGIKAVLSGMPFKYNVRAFVQQRLTYGASLVSSYSLSRGSCKQMSFFTYPMVLDIAHITHRFRSNIVCFVIPFVEQIRSHVEQCIVFLSAVGTGEVAISCFAIVRFQACPFLQVH